jgi:hypothetical protein
LRSKTRSPRRLESAAYPEGDGDVYGEQRRDYGDRLAADERASAATPDRNLQGVGFISAVSSVHRVSEMKERGGREPGSRT